MSTLPAKAMADAVKLYLKYLRTHESEMKGMELASFLQLKAALKRYLQK